jgi:hypothetical protein
VERAGLEKLLPMIFRNTEWHWTVSTSIKRSYCTPPPPARDLFVHVLKARDPEQASVCCYPAVATGASLLANPHLDLALEYNPKLQPS